MAAVNPCKENPFAHAGIVAGRLRRAIERTTGEWYPWAYPSDGDLYEAARDCLTASPDALAVRPLVLQMGGLRSALTLSPWPRVRVACVALKLRA